MSLVLRVCTCVACAPVSSSAVPVFNDFASLVVHVCTCDACVPVSGRQKDMAVACGVMFVICDVVCVSGAAWQHLCQQCSTFMTRLHSCLQNPLCDLMCACLGCVPVWAEFMCCWCTCVRLRCCVACVPVLTVRYLCCDSCDITVCGQSARRQTHVAAKVTYGCNLI